MKIYKEYPRSYEERPKNPVYCYTVLWITEAFELKRPQFASKKKAIKSAKKHKYDSSLPVMILRQIVAKDTFKKSTKTKKAKWKTKG